MSQAFSQSAGTGLHSNLSLEALCFGGGVQKGGQEKFLQKEIWPLVNFLALFSWKLETIGVSVVLLGQIAY